MSTTEQEVFWQGDFGDGYRTRNDGPGLLGRKTHLFARILSATRGVESVLELGANLGLNLQAIAHLRPATNLAALEINAGAAAELGRRLPQAQVTVGSILDLTAAQLGQHDLTFTCGVLIHLAPERLGSAYDLLYQCARRYVLVVEYYHPTPVEIPYRGHAGRLFKRDFAGELLDRHSDLELVDYGFLWRRDPVFPQDDLTWFLLRKR